ncbi:MAG: TlpA family protein disulfide reductase [Anaerolineae bacterium]|jgi:thiol-disulfide isomerase/thioredoxin|nr:TlpA family protein disulfide reductase [Anaerolineae bacterium]
MLRYRPLILNGLLLLALAACSTAPAAGPTAAPAPTETAVLSMTAEAAPMTEEAHSGSSGSAMMTAEAAPMTDSAASAPAWAALPLVNARTGATFTLGDFAGKTVFVEPMATWCTNCRRQQRTLIDVLPQVNADAVVFVSLSVEDGLANQTLADYADDNGFNWLFAVATPELAQALIGQFGRTVVNPPATPHFIIAPDGRVGDLMTGFQDAAGVLNSLAAAAG